MSFSRKNLFKNINSKHMPKSESYLRRAKGEIDRAVEEANIDDNFYIEYYRLKRDIELRNVYLTSVGIAALVSVVVAYALEVEKTIGFVGYIVILVIGMLMAMVLAFNSITKQGCVLEPYLLDRMEKKIWTDATPKDVNSYALTENSFVGSDSKF